MTSKVPTNCRNHSLKIMKLLLEYWLSINQLPKKLRSPLTSGTRLATEGRVPVLKELIV